MKKLKKVDPALERLYATPPQPMPFGSSLVNRAFLLQRNEGNILIYGSEANDSVSFEAHGGVERHYLNHGHEAMFMSSNIVAPIYCHEKESATVAKKTKVAQTFSTQHTLDDDFEIIPMPSHTSGTTCYLWDNGTHHILFTGDMLVPRGDKWEVVVLDESTRSDYIKSLQQIRELNFDILMPWASNEGKAYFTKTNESYTKARIDEAVKRVQNGDKH